MAAPKFARHNGLGAFVEAFALIAADPTPANNVNRIVATNDNGYLDPTLLNATITGGAALQAGKLLQLDAGGRIDATVMPVGFGQDADTMQASEALAAGDNVNVHSVSGAFRVRKADAASGKEANGFVDATVASGAQARVRWEMSNTNASGLTPGRVFLGASGAATSTPPTAPGSIVQIIGFTISATSYSFQYNAPITLA